MADFVLFFNKMDKIKSGTLVFTLFVCFRFNNLEKVIEVLVANDMRLPALFNLKLVVCVRVLYEVVEVLELAEY